MTAKRTNDDFQKSLLKIHNGTITTNDKYINGKTKMKFSCNVCGTNFETSGQHIISPSNPTGCPICSKNKRVKKATLSKKDIIERVAKEGNNEYEIIDWLEYKNVRSNVIFRHNIDGHEFKMTVNNFFSGQRCPLHRYENLSQLFKPQTHEYFINRIKTECEDYNEYEFLEEFKNNSDKIKVRHKSCGHEYSVSAIKFLTGRRCPNCSKPQNSKAMKEIKKYLKDNKIDFETEKCFSDLKNPEGDRSLRLDIYIESLNLAIEYDGEFHDKLNSYNTEEDLERRKLLDKTKNNYCRDKGIRLLRIHHSKKKEIKNILDKYLNSTTIESIFNENLIIEEKQVE